MGVYIKGAEMPKTCRDCPCYYYRDGDGEYTYTRDGCSALNVQFNEHVYWGVDIHDPFKGRYEECPLIEVPEPHGRLIDADKVVSYVPGDEAPLSKYLMAKAVLSVPTVIERSEL